MSDLVVHELDCAEGTAVYREATTEEALNLQASTTATPVIDTKYEMLKRAAKQASPELFDFVCYTLGVSNDTE